MGMSAKLLGADERVVLRMRTHGKAMILPALGLIAAGALLGVGTALVPSDYRPIGQYLIVLPVGALAVWWSVLPFLRWRSRTYTVTNHRLITREGILNKTGKNLPLMRINDVSYERSLLDRMLGCGTLVIQTAAEGAVVLDDVPDVEHVHLTLTELLFDPVAPTQNPYALNPPAQTPYAPNPYNPNPNPYAHNQYRQHSQQQGAEQPLFQPEAWGEPYGPRR